MNAVQTSTSTFVKQLPVQDSEPKKRFTVNALTASLNPFKPITFGTETSVTNPMELF